MMSKTMKNEFKRSKDLAPEGYKWLVNASSDYKTNEKNMPNLLKQLLNIECIVLNEAYDKNGNIIKNSVAIYVNNTHPNFNEL